MKFETEISVPPTSRDSVAAHRSEIARLLAIEEGQISGYRILHRSLDARPASPVYRLRIEVFVDELPIHPAPFSLELKNVAAAEPAVIIGAGPAGLFAALRLIELGIRPIVIERGKAVRDRRRDIAKITKEGEVDPDSNYCFGEGGAGTFSDGKLYTRSGKRGSTERILQILVLHGASPEILIDAHPHIGTNKLPQVVELLRQTIIAHGGELHFGTRVTGLLRDSEVVRGVLVQENEQILAKAVIVATGHSARDMFEILLAAKIPIERKPFALGVRVEHPQSIIDDIHYRKAARSEFLPPASYSLVTQCQGRGVFSFCMCPGGIICPASTSNTEVVVNGWSPSKRNSYFANSGIVVQVMDEDLAEFGQENVFAGVALQQNIESLAASAGGGKQKAPAARLTDFINARISANLPRCSYLPGITSSDLRGVFPPAFYKRLIGAFQEFGKKRKGYITEEAVVVAVESRTSSPVRVPRDPKTLMSPALDGLFPCGEGAGYAGGIMSAAMDGENCASAVKTYLHGHTS